MSLAAKLPYDHPYAGGYPGIGSQPLPTDADAIDYLSRMATADGAGVETGVAVAVDAFFRDSKAAGVVSSLKACCILAGARTLAGALVPVVGDAPTNVADGFVEGDYSRTAGLTGDGATTYLDSGRAGNADPRNDAHAAVYGTTFTQSTNWLGGEGASTKNIALSWYSPYFYHNRNMTNPGNQRTLTSFVSSGFAGVSRSGAEETSARYGGTTYTDSSASSEPSSDNSFVFAYNDAGVTSDYSDSTLAFYSIGSSLDLAKLDTHITAYVTAIGAAI